LRPDLDWLWLDPVVVVEAPVRQAVDPLQRTQIRSPAQALSNVVMQLRQVRSMRLKVPCVDSSASALGRSMIPGFIQWFLRYG
jgi:hypothetical protein